MSARPSPVSSPLAPSAATDVIIRRFEIMAALRPEATALRWESTSMTYAELNTRANQLGGCLRRRGIRPDSLVGVYLDRTPDLLVAILAVLKSGGAYLPLDLACPDDRLAFLLHDSRTQIVLTQQDLSARLGDFEGEVICLDQEAEQLARGPRENLPVVAKPSDLAYVIYTSGSTGRPKGVLVTQENVARLFTSTEEIFHFGPHDVWTLFHSSAFDFSVWEIFGALLYGGCLVIVPYMVSRSATAFRALLVREKVTVLNQTPSAFRQLVQADLAAPEGDLSALRYVIFGGEALDFQSLRPWFTRYGEDHPRCINMYGITETTVHVTYHGITPQDLAKGGSNIGRPLLDLHIYLVDAQGRRVARGQVGEMLVGGRGVARGYLHRPELTAERFIPDTFAGRKGALLYRSGDLAREREDGDFEYLGRIDHQVKIRGFRVELSEIEAALARHSLVRECVVLCRKGEGESAEPRLIAYVIPRAAGPINIEQLRTHLFQILPGYMVPGAFVFLSQFPLTLNGKLDRDLLPAPGTERPQLAVGYLPPEGDFEELLVRLWTAILGRDQVGTDDNFFDLGGDSLMLTTFHRQLETELQRSIPITDLFQCPTIRRLAAHLDGAKKSGPAQSKTEARAQLQRAAMLRARQMARPQP